MIHVCTTQSIKKGKFIYLLLYVDDMLIACIDKSKIEYTKNFLKKEFDMKSWLMQRKFWVQISLETRV